MRKLIAFLLICIPMMCSARTLHVGNLSIPLHDTKFTTPSINIQDDNQRLYAPLIPQFISNRLHVGYDNKVFSVCMGEKTHVGHHWFVGDCLVDADDDVYLESTGVQYIDTGLVADVEHTIHSEYDMALLAFNNGWTGANLFTQVRSDPVYNSLTFYNEYDVIDIDYIPINLSQKYHIISEFLINDGEGIVERLSINNNTIARYWGSDVSYVSGVCVLKLGGLEEYPGVEAKLYKYKLVVNNKIARYMIPVPAGMQIGNFTVPENGMWDVVEQKFYGNMGTGDFIYGVDE